MVMKIKKAIPVKNIHLTNRGKLALLFIKEIYLQLKLAIRFGRLYWQM